MFWPPEIYAKQRIPHQWLNAVRDALLRSIIGGRGITIQRDGQHVVIEATGAGARGGTGTSSGVPYAQILTGGIHDTYLECAFYDPATDTQLGAVLVAKPFHLRAATYDTLTIPYDNGDDVTYAYNTYRDRDATMSGTENQVVTPDYHVGEILRVWQSTTGITVAGEQLAWEDANVRGRDWAEAA